MKSTFQSTGIFFKYLLVVFLTLASCQKDDGPADDIAIDDPNDPNDDPPNSTGRFSDFISCNIIATPSAVNLNSTYTKFINCSGIPIVGSSNVPDQALIDASAIMEFMLTGIGTVRNRLITGDSYVILYEEGVALNDVPESDGLGGCPNGGLYNFNPNNSLSVIISPVPNLLCDHALGSTGGNILVHEIAHMIDIGGIRQIDNGFQSTLSSTFTTARSNGLWDNVYAATNKEEYFAETTTIWFGQNWIGPIGGDGFRNEIGTRAQLQTYDLGIYNLINSKITNLTDVPGCREPVIWGATANCPETVTDIDGNVYQVVNIGPMCWMKENLRTTHYRDGSPILNLTDEGQWSSTTTGAWSYYDNDQNMDSYGKLYNGHAASNPAGLCPIGWHVPTIQELSDLTQYAGGDYSGKALREVTLWNLPDDTNSSGFTALPSGFREFNGVFGGMGGFTIFVSTTFNNVQNLYSKELGNGDYVGSFGRNPNTGFSCRCKKD